MHRLLNAIDGVTCLEPQGAFYAFPSFRAVLERGVTGTPVASTLELADLILSEAKVAIVPGRGVRRARLRPPVVRPRRRRPRRGHRAHRRPAEPMTGAARRRPAVRLVAVADHRQPTGRGRGRRPRGPGRRWRRLVGREPAGGGRTHPARPLPRPTAPRTDVLPTGGTCAPRCTSTAVGRGRCATAWSCSATGTTSASTASIRVASRSPSTPEPAVATGTAVRRRVLARRRLAGLRAGVPRVRRRATARRSTSWWPSPLDGSARTIRRGAGQRARLRVVAPGPRRAAGVDAVGPSAHAVGRHRAVGRRRSTARRTGRRPGCRHARLVAGGRRGVGRAAGVGGRRLAALPVGPVGVVEPRGATGPTARGRSSPSTPRSVARSGCSVGGGSRRSTTDGSCAASPATGSPAWPSSTPTGGRPTIESPLTDGRPGGRRRRTATWSSWGPPRPPSSPRFAAGSPTMGRSSCARLRPPRDLGHRRRVVLRARADQLPVGGDAPPTRSAIAPTNPTTVAVRRRAPAPARDQPRRPDRRGAGPARPGGAVLDQPGLRRGRRQLRRLHRLRPPLPPAARPAVGHRRRRGLRRRRPAARRAGPGRPGSPGHPRRQRRRLHHARRAHVPRHVRRRGQSLRRRRPRGAGPRDPQVRVAATSTGSSGPYPEARRRLRGPVADPPHRRLSIARSSCSRAWRTRSCRRTRPR